MASEKVVELCSSCGNGRPQQNSRWKDCVVVLELCGYKDCLLVLELYGSNIVLRCRKVMMRQRALTCHVASLTALMRIASVARPKAARVARPTAAMRKQILRVMTAHTISKRHRKHLGHYWPMSKLPCLRMMKVRAGAAAAAAQAAAAATTTGAHLRVARPA